VFNSKVTKKANGMGNLAGRARDASTTATQTAQTAAQTAQTAQQTAQQAAQQAAQAAQVAAVNVSSAAQTAAQGVGKSVRRGVHSARGWTAPRLETAADYLDNAAGYATTTVTPRVSSALRSTAQQVKPETTRKRGVRSMLAWSALGVAVLAAAGAAAAMVRQRYRTAMEADTETDISETSETAGSDNPGTADESSAANGSAPVKDVSTDGGLNGRVSSGR
jgi:hypothetical protein